MRLHYLVKLRIRVFMTIPMLEKRNSENFTYLRLLLVDFTEINISYYKLGKHYFRIPEELKK